MNLSGFTQEQAEAILETIRLAADGMFTQDEMIAKIKSFGEIAEFFDANGNPIIT